MTSNTVGRPMEILLVEDSLMSARLTMGALRKGQTPHRLTWLSDGDEALEFLHRRGKYRHAPRPDLLLLDLGLPGRDGRAVLTEIRADESLKDLPVVVLTASTDEEDRTQSERLQVESYLTKPVDLEQFQNVVAQLSRFWKADMIVPGSDADPGVG
jgi:two-component system, chemotaxis family, response regulator Rcp1